MASDRRYGKVTLGALGLAVLLVLAWATPAQTEDLEAAMAAKTGDYRTAIARWTAFAEQGDPDSAYRLGQAYETGQGVPRDPQQAQHWYRAAAAGGSGKAAFALGEMAETVERPDGLPQDLGIAVAWYRRALADGDPRARERLAALGAPDGAAPVPRPHPTAASGAPTPTPTAVRVAPPAPAPSRPEPPRPADPTASFDRAIAVWRAHGLDGTDAATIAALEAAAKQGQPLAQYDLAYAYQHGLGVPAEPVRAYAWYKRAENSSGPDRLRQAAEANGRVVGAQLSEAQKQAADRIDTNGPAPSTGR